MSIQLGPVSVSPGVLVKLGIINVGAVFAVKLSNSSPFDLTITGFGVQGSGTIPAGTEYMLDAKIENLGYLNILPVNNYNVSGTGIVNADAYLVGENVPKGTWPITIPTQTVKTTVSGASTLSNEGTPPTAQVIDIGDSHFAGLITINNDGTAVWSVDATGTVKHTIFRIVSNPATLFQISQAGDIVEFLGQLTVDQVFNLNAVNIGTFNGSVSGSVTIWQEMQGTHKKVKVIMNNWSDINTRSFLLPAPFTQYVSINGFSDFGVSGNGGLQLLNGASPKTIDVSTTVAAAGGTGTGQTTMFKWSFGSCNCFATSVDHVQLLANTTAHNAIIILEGI